MWLKSPTVLMSKYVSISNLKNLNRLKVDLTKYMEEHLFKFDSAFGE